VGLTVVMDDRALVTYAVPFGAIAQLVERFHGMEEVRSSILLSSTRKPRSEHISLVWASSVFRAGCTWVALRSGFMDSGATLTFYVA
jgi:hypothetical protein